MIGRGRAVALHRLAPLPAGNGEKEDYRDGVEEHDPEEIYDNMVKAIAQLVKGREDDDYSLAITNQRETVVVWDKETSKPVYNALVWQDNRGAALCRQLTEEIDMCHLLDLIYR